MFLKNQNNNTIWDIIENSIPYQPDRNRLQKIYQQTR